MIGAAERIIEAMFAHIHAHPLHIHTASHHTLQKSQPAQTCPLTSCIHTSPHGEREGGGCVQKPQLCYLNSKIKIK